MTPDNNDTPFSPPTDAEQIDDTHQTTDNATNIDSHELYDEGLAGAAEVSEPNAGNAVTGYDPEADSRNEQ